MSELLYCQLSGLLGAVVGCAVVMARGVTMSTEKLIGTLLASAVGFTTIVAAAKPYLVQ